MNLKRLGASSHFGACGVNGVTVRRPPAATHCAVYTYPVPNEEWPLPAGYGNRSHPLVQFVNQRERTALPANPVAAASVIGEIDFTTSIAMYGQPIDLPSDCHSLNICDGGAVGSTAIIRGRVMWYAEVD